MRLRAVLLIAHCRRLADLANYTLYNNTVYTHSQCIESVRCEPFKDPSVYYYNFKMNVSANHCVLTQFVDLPIIAIHLVYIVVCYFLLFSVSFKHFTDFFHPKANT